MRTGSGIAKRQPLQVTMAAAGVLALLLVVHHACRNTTVQHGVIREVLRTHNRVGRGGEPKHILNNPKTAGCG
jgi:hypothetical protein